MKEKPSIDNILDLLNNYGAYTIHKSLFALRYFGCVAHYDQHSRLYDSIIRVSPPNFSEIKYYFSLLSSDKNISSFGLFAFIGYNLGYDLFSAGHVTV